MTERLAGAGGRSAVRATAAAASPTTPARDVVEGGLLPSSVALVGKHRWSYLTPMAAVAGAGALAVVLLVVVNAWTAPTLLRDGAFTFVGLSTPTVVTAAAAAGLLAVLAAGAFALVALRSAGDQLGRPADSPAALREVCRRWPLVVTGAVILLATGAGLWFGLLPLLNERGPVLAGAVLLVGIAILELIARVLPVAVAHGIGTVAAIGRIRTLRRHADPTVYDRWPGLVLLLLAAPTAGTVLAIRAGAAMIPSPFGDAVALLAYVAVAPFAPVVLATALTRLHLRLTRRATNPGGAPRLAWAGVDRCARSRTDDAAGTLPNPRTRRRAAVRRVAVAAVLLLAAPAVFVVVVATNPTPAIEPQFVTLREPDQDQPMPVTTQDGVAIVDIDAVTVCVPGEPCGPSIGGQLQSFDWPEALAATADSSHGPAVSGRRPEAFAATADPDGQGLALVVNASECRDDDCESVAVLVTCAPADCFGPEPRATPTVARLPHKMSWGSSRNALVAVAAAHGTYAIVTPTGTDLEDDRMVLTRCRTASCQDPQTFPLGRAYGNDVVRAQFAPDDTLWVVQSDHEQEVVRVRSLAPGATTLTDAFTLQLANLADGFDDHAVLRLAIRDDGTPVVLYHDNSNDLVVVSCDDAQCTDRTTTTLPIRLVDSKTADLAIDATGRPLIATSGGAGVLVHSCTDRTCTSLRSGLVSLGYPMGGIDVIGAPQPFLLLDSDDRPVFALSTSHGNRSTSEVAWCTETRCGL